MSLERIFKALINLGLSQTDARAYIHLATKGPDLAKNVAFVLSISNRQAYRSLKRLKTKGLTATSDGKPAEFSALPFEEVLDMLIETKEEQAKSIRESREGLISSWQTNEKEKARKEKRGGEKLEEEKSQ